MHIPESLQDLADSEAVQFLKRPKTILRIFAGVRSSCGPATPWVTENRSHLLDTVQREWGPQEDKWGKRSKR